MPLARTKLKLAKNNAQRFRSTSRVTPIISHRGLMLKGNSVDKAKKIALRVLRQIPVDKSLPLLNRGRIFRRSAEDSLLKRKAISAMHCSERCNLAISLLNASGVKSWLARMFVRSKNKESKVEWHFHDFVEFEHNGQLMTLAFDNVPLPNKYNFQVIEGTVDRFYTFKEHPIIFRGADSRQIGGVKDWNSYKKYVAKFSKINGLFSEFKKNKSRIDLLIENGVIPVSVEGYM